MHSFREIFSFLNNFFKDNHLPSITLRLPSKYDFTSSHNSFSLLFLVLIEIFTTFSNGGVFGSLFGTPIINPPQSAILGMHGVFERPVVRNGQVKSSSFLDILSSSFQSNFLLGCHPPNDVHLSLIHI